MGIIIVRTAFAFVLVLYVLRRGDFRDLRAAELMVLALLGIWATLLV
jgi:hypothetical protein